MSKYTIELRHVCVLFSRDQVEEWFKKYEESQYLTSEEISVIKSRGTWSKDRLATKIVNHYFTREIGEETPALFRLRVEQKMEEIMEEYLPLIYSASIKYDPLVNVDYVETYESSRNGEGKTKTTGRADSNTSGLSVNSDTPQGQISKTAILNGTYASSTSANEGEDSSTTSGTSENSDSQNEQYKKSIRGNSGVSATAQRMVQQYRENIRAIDREIIEHLQPLFMGIY